MAKTLKNNMRWSKAERTKLMQLIATYSKPTLGFNEIAVTMGRTPAAVSWQYYNSVKSYKKKNKSVVPNMVQTASKLKLEFQISNIRIFDNKLVIEIEK